VTTPLPISLATAQAGVLHRRQLTQAGLDNRAVTRRVQRGELLEIAPHVFVIGGTATTWHQQLWMALLTARPGAVVSHRSAARLHGHGRFPDTHIDVLEVENTHHRIRHGAGHRTSWLPDHHRSEVDHLPATSPARTAFDLAGLVSYRRRAWDRPNITRAQAERALDDALADGVALADLREVLHTLGKRGRPGTVLFREFLEERDEGFVATESELEDLLHRVLADRGMPLPERQRTLGSTDAPIGRVDFVYVAERVVIETDGRRHHTSLVDAEADRWRDMELASAGWIVVRVTWRQLRDDPGRFVRTLRSLLASRSS